VDAHDVVFYACNAVALFGWLVLIAFPRARLAEWLARTMLPSLLIAGAYSALVLVTLVTGGSEGDFFSLDGVRRLFDDRTVLTAAWIHYLAFDLAVGSWMWLRARELGLAHRWLVPCLLATLWLGPVGFLAFWAVKRGALSRLRPGGEAPPRAPS
jgi:hypothetical protein